MIKCEVKGIHCSDKKSPIISDQDLEKRQISIGVTIECTATNPLLWSCCNLLNKCGENEGDCDHDDDCNAGLKCGTDNCPAGFHALHDCCYKKGIRGDVSYEFFF